MFIRLVKRYHGKTSTVYISKHLYFSWENTLLSLRFIQQASAVCCSRSSYMHFHEADLSLQDTTLQAALIHSQRSVSRNKHSLILLQTAGETFFPPLGHTSEHGHSSHPPIVYTHTFSPASRSAHPARFAAVPTQPRLSPHTTALFFPIHTRARRSVSAAVPPARPGWSGGRAVLPRGPVWSGRGRRGAPGRSRGARRPHVRRGGGSVRPAVPRDRLSAGSGGSSGRSATAGAAPLSRRRSGPLPPARPPRPSPAPRHRGPAPEAPQRRREGPQGGKGWQGVPRREPGWGIGGGPVPHSPPRRRRDALSPRSSQCRGRLRPPGKHEPQEAKGEEAAKSVPPPAPPASPKKHHRGGGKKTQNQTFLAAVSPSPEEHEPKHTRTRPRTAPRTAHWTAPRRLPRWLVVLPARLLLPLPFPPLHAAHWEESRGSLRPLARTHVNHRGAPPLGAFDWVLASLHARRLAAFAGCHRLALHPPPPLHPSLAPAPSSSAS